MKGKHLADATVQDLKGADVTTASLLGEPLVINIWGSTCGPCKKELPDFAAVQQQFAGKVRFVGIDYLPPSDDEEQFARSRGVKYDLFYDTNGDFISKVGIGAFPVTLFITADGTIEAVEVNDGDPCPHCGAPMEIARGIEIGHVFQLGRKYAEKLGLQVLDHRAVVDDLVAHIDRRAIFAQGDFDDLDGAVDASTEATRTGQQDAEGRFRHKSWMAGSTAEAGLVSVAAQGCRA